MLDAGIAAVFFALLAWAAWEDIRTFRIPNWLVGALFALFVLAFTAGTIDRNQWPGHFSAGVAALAGGMALFARNWIGGGDAKLFAVLALWAGWPDTLRLLAVTALAGGAVSTFILLRFRYSAKKGLASATAEERARGPKVPYGVAIATAGLDFWSRILAAPFLFPAIHL